MGLLGSSKKKKAKQADEGSTNDAHASTSSRATRQPAINPKNNKPYRHAPLLSKTPFNIAGLPVNVFGLEELTPAVSRASAPRPPDVAIIIHMHGRGGTADNEERIVRHLYEAATAQSSSAAPGGQRRELLVVNFDARNHGHRLTSEKGQKAWKQGNKTHAQDLYGMITGDASDVSFLADYLPSYLFPYDERTVSCWVVTGKSLGGHSTWHVLADDSRFQIGVPFIGCPSFTNLIRGRAKNNHLPPHAPHLPASLLSLVSRTDPARFDPSHPNPSSNPFGGKKICICSGAEDTLVPWSAGEDFVGLLMRSEGARRGEVRVRKEEGVGHEVTESMVEEGGRWIGHWAQTAAAGAPTAQASRAAF